MKIVFANKFYYLKGGAERYAFDLAAMLASHGHEVVPFSMRDKRDLPTPWAKYFVSPVETENVSFSLGGLKTAGRLLYSFEAKRKFAGLLDKAKPGLVHVHNIYHQISPSILPEAKRRGLPVVMTAHDYKLIAPNYALFHDGHICEATKPDRFWRAVGHRCIKGSRMAGALEALEMSFHRSFGLYLNNIDLIITPSRFMHALFMSYGIPEAKLVHVPHFTETVSRQPVYGGTYGLFVGRLSPEKGVDVLIKAAAKVKNVPIHIVGTGPQEQYLRDLAESLRANNVVFKGFMEGEKLAAEYAGARFVAVPSIFYEVVGLVALEAYAYGKPLVASQIGGLAETVIDGQTGRFASVGDVDDWAEQISALWDNPQICEDMGRAGRRLAETEYAPVKHYERIIEVYRKAGAKI